MELCRTVDEGWFWRGALRGRSPCTREGRRPDRPELQWSETARLKIGVKKSEERVAFARLSQGRELIVAGTFGIFLGRLKVCNRTTT